MEKIKSKNGKPYAILIDMDYLTGLQSSRLLAERGVPVLGLAKDPDHYCTKTNTCEKVFKVDTRGQELIDTLMEMGPKFDLKPVLYPCQDNSVLLVSRNRQNLLKFYHISLPSEETVELLMDKNKFYDFAVKENLPVAKFFLLKSKEDAVKVSKELTYPCIIKPPIKSPKWEQYSKLYKVYKVFSEEEYFKTYDMCSQWADLLMVQEWIVGTDSDLYSSNCYYSLKSEPLATFTAKKLRQWPIEIGNTSLGIDCIDDEVLRISLELFKKVDYVGLVYLELKKDNRTGKYYIIEPNIGRPTGRSALSEACGVDLLYTMYCDCLGIPLPSTRYQTYKGIKWIHIRTDLQSAYNYWKQGKITISEYFKSVRGPKYFAVLSLKDPRPFLGELKLIFSFIFKSLISGKKIQQT